MANRVLLLALLLALARAAELPSHARGGRLWSLLQAENAMLFAARGEAQWFQQRVDHFRDDIESDSEGENATFGQRFYEEDAFWRRPDGPVILSIGGEGSLDRAPQGLIQVLAQRLGAKILALEHRFYGQSIPNGRFSTDNYRLLTVQQALADLAFFRDAYQRERLGGGANKWVAIGGSYPGALSAWFRVAYPNTTVAALASSGVVLPVYAFHEFDEQVAISAGQECADVLRKTTRALEHELAHGNGTRVRRLFGARSDMDDADFFYMAADSAAMAVQYGHKNVLCDHMIGAAKLGWSLVDAFAEFTVDMYGRDFGSKCFYDTKCLATMPASAGDDLSWRWQKCSQLAYFQIAPAVGSLRSSIVDIEYHERQCHAVFGDVVNPSKGVKEITELYGGDHPHGHNIFFSNGADDPWQRASVVKTLVPDDEVANLAVCDLCGHCGDLGGNPNVPEPLKKQRQEIIEYLTKWVEAEDSTETSLQQFEETELAKTSDSKVTMDVHRSSPLVLVPIVFAFAALLVVLHADLVVRDAPIYRRVPAVYDP